MKILMIRRPDIPSEVLDRGVVPTIGNPARGSRRMDKMYIPKEDRVNVW